MIRVSNGISARMLATTLNADLRSSMLTDVQKQSSELHKSISLDNKQE
jgi:hypothetical protein